MNDNYVESYKEDKDEFIEQDEVQEDIKVTIKSLKKKSEKLENSLQEMNDRITKLEKDEINCKLNISLLYNSVNILGKQFEESKNDYFFWKINDFSKVKICKLRIYSEPFYFFKNGYKMRLVLYPNGCFNIKFLSLFFEIMSTDHDLLLQWPFCYNVTLTLLNQKGGKDQSYTVVYVSDKHRAYDRPISMFNIGLGSYEFIEQSRLYPESFIMNDSLSLVCSLSRS